MARLRASSAGRRGFKATVSPDLAAAVGRVADECEMQRWRVLEDALELGLPLIPPVGEALPHFAYDHTRQRGRSSVDVFAEISLAVSDAVRDAAAARHAHVWWVSEEALRYGLPLLPAPIRARTPDDDLELPQSA